MLWGRGASLLEREGGLINFDCSIGGRGLNGEITVYKYMYCMNNKKLTKGENSVVDNVLVCVLSITIPEKKRRT